MEQIEKKAEDVKVNASNNSGETESSKFEMKEKSGKISKQFETISELESEIEELKNRSQRKTFNVSRHKDSCPYKCYFSR